MKEWKKLQLVGINQEALAAKIVANATSCGGGGCGCGGCWSVAGWPTC